VIGRALPPLDPVEEWLDWRDVVVRVNVTTWELWPEAARLDGYGPNGENVAGWLRDLADQRAGLG
jgi:hypothetical protein